MSDVIGDVSLTAYEYVSEQNTPTMRLNSHSPITSVIFDMDGLMIDSERIAHEAYLRAAHKFGFQMNEGVHLCITGRSESDIIGEMARLYAVDVAQARTWREYVVQQKSHILNEIGGQIGVKTGLLDLISYLREHSIPYCVASSSTRAQIDERLTNAGVRSLFEHIVDGTSVEHAKPSPEIFLKAADLIHVTPEETLVLEDSLMGILGAKAGGFIAGFIHDDLSDLGSIESGLPVVRKTPSVNDISTCATLSFNMLADVIPYIQAHRGN